MKRKDLIDHVEGSYLKKQYLEAFLAESAYIEGCCKLFVDYNYFLKLANPLSGEQHKASQPLIKKIKFMVEGLNFNGAIDFLLKAELISAGLASQLQQYKKKRNKVTHDLIAEMAKEQFDEELKEVLGLGKKIRESREFQEIQALLDSLEQLNEQRKLTERKSGR